MIDWDAIFERNGITLRETYDGHIPATESDIRKMEERLGVTLPPAYRDFVRKFGGHMIYGVDKRDTYHVEHLELLDGGGIAPPVGFCGFGTVSNIFDDIDAYDDRLPKGLMPIGNDICGNLFCLGISGELVDKVYYWDHETENLDGEPWWDNLVLVQNSFLRFIEGIRQGEPIDPADHETDSLN